MFARWTNARVKAADRALQEGRLDDALERLAPFAAKKDRSAESVLEDAARALAARARLHAQSGRLYEALRDLDKLDELGRADAEAIALRDRLRGELKIKIDQQQVRVDAVARAREQLQAGQLESVRAALDQVPDARQRDQIRSELDIRERRARERLEQAQAALKAGDLALAYRHFTEGAQHHGRTRAADEFAAALAAGLQKALDELFREGRLDRWFAHAALANGLQRFAPSLNEPLALQDQIESAARLLASNEFTSLRQSLLRLQAAQPKTSWVREALNALDTIERGRGALLAGPLALVPVGNLTRAPGISPSAPVAGQPIANDDAVTTRSPLLMLVDGTGSVLLVFGDVTRIGRADGAGAVDVPIPGDLLSHHADVVRAGEDYFLVAHGPATVNATPTTRTLLRDGDRVRLGASVQFVFRKPSTRSESAALLLSSRARLAQDVSQVILFRSTCLIGPQGHCHLQTREGRERLVLYERSGKLYLRHAAESGQAINPVAAVPLNATRDFADLRFTVKPYGAGVNTVA